MLLVGAACVLAVASVAAVGAAQTKWRLPVTIEVLKDVPLETTQGTRQPKGVLYVSGKPPFVIKKGQRFLMVKIEPAGGCRIRFEAREDSVASCPWLDGVTDHQVDVFKIVPELESPVRAQITTDVVGKVPVYVISDVVYLSSEPSPLAEVWQHADAIVHLRIMRALPAQPQRQSDGGRQLCTEHEAAILEVLKADKAHGPAGERFNLLQESAGVWEEDGHVLRGADPYSVGTELVAFLTWQPSSERFAVWRDTLAVVDGRVYRFWWGKTGVDTNEDSGPLFRDVPRGVPVQNLLAKLRTLTDVNR